MKLVIETKGIQDEIHCSQSSSVNSCNYMYETMGTGIKRCKLFNYKDLEYDWDYHAYKRCDECLKAEYVEDFKEELRIAELGNKQLYEEIKITLNEKEKLLEALSEIDTHIRSVKEPIPYIIATLQRVLPEYQYFNNVNKKFDELSNEEFKQLLIKSGVGVYEPKEFIKSEKE